MVDFKVARLASGISRNKAAELANFSAPTLDSRELDPGQFRLVELKSMYDQYNDVGKRLLLESVKDFFL